MYLIIVIFTSIFLQLDNFFLRTLVSIENIYMLYIYGVEYQYFLCFFQFSILK